MHPATLRAILNTCMALCAAGATTAAALSQPLVAAAFASVGSFLFAWANLSKPGDIKPAASAAPLPVHEPVSTPAVVLPVSAAQTLNELRRAEVEQSLSEHRAAEARQADALPVEAAKKNEGSA